jgi:hypothetical protein
MDGEVGDTCEFFSLPGPTFPGSMFCMVFAPPSGLPGVASPGFVCAKVGETAKMAAKAPANMSFRMSLFSFYHPTLGKRPALS